MLPPQKIDIWVIALAEIPASQDFEMLSADEQERAACFRHARERERFLATRVALRKIAGDLLGLAPAAVQFRRDPNAKPQIANATAAPWHFNLALADGILAIAFTRSGPIGIDLERVDPDVDLRELSARFVLPRAGEITPRQHFQDWVAREAMGKCSGRGFASIVRPENFAVHYFEPAPDFVGCLATAATSDSALIFHDALPAERAR
ncbi:MAG: hypothetical protein M3R59_08345 [Verrucomicrobiota bacterium]|nr:hypothetical protein [Verrucomicrobiota bacterium]